MHIIYCTWVSAEKHFLRSNPKIIITAPPISKHTWFSKGIGDGTLIGLLHLTADEVAKADLDAAWIIFRRSIKNRLCRMTDRLSTD